MRAQILFVTALLAATASATSFVDVAALVPEGELVPELAALKGKMSCSQCSLIADIIVELGSNATKAAAALPLLDAECSSHFNGTLNTLCQDAAKLLLETVLPAAIKGANTLAWPEPSALCSVILDACPQPCCKSETAPEQVHLSLTHSPSEMHVSWVTRNITATAVAMFGLSASSLDHTTTSGPIIAETYSFGSWVGQVHGTTMTGLKPNTTYFYKVGDAAGGWSPVHSFTTMPADVGVSRPLRVVQIADTGYGPDSDTTIAKITELVTLGQVDIVLCVGDGGYADGYAPHDDAWSLKLEPIASAVPVMTAPGNHELWANFTAYKVRWGHHMPTDPYAEGMFYSFNANVAHFLMTNTESPIDTPMINNQQQAFIKADLEAAAAKRDSTPWVIAAGHRGLYCSNPDRQCTAFSQYLRERVEDLYYANKVDVVIQGHIHNQEVSFPVYNETVMGSYGKPGAPVYVTNGAGGNREGTGAIDHPDSWSAWHSRDLGFGYLEIEQSSLAYNFMAANGTYLTSFTLTK